MRLTCPECAAQYAVEDRMIPEKGREVQCSNCNHRWFQESTAETAAVTVAQPAQPAEEFTRRPVDPKVLAILREEAEREQAARLAEAEARKAGSSDDITESEPQVETSEPVKPVPEKEPPEAPSGKGFGAGAWLAILIFLALTLLYVGADAVADVFPASEEALTSYVESVDSARHWLRGQVGMLLGDKSASN